jgi:cobalamin biosynthesis protein CobT
MKKILIVGLIFVLCIISAAAISDSTENSVDRSVEASDGIIHYIDVNERSDDDISNSSDDDISNSSDDDISNSSDNDISNSGDMEATNRGHTIPSQTITISPLNTTSQYTPDYDAKIEALEKQIAEQKKEIERQGTILDQIISFLRNVSGMK